jgi:hypothetical protein
VLQLFVIHMTILLNPKFHHGIIEFYNLHIDIGISMINIFCAAISVLYLVLQWYYSSNILFCTNKWNYFELGYIISSFALASQKTTYVTLCRSEIPEVGYIRFLDYEGDPTVLTTC